MLDRQNNTVLVARLIGQREAENVLDGRRRQNRGPTLLFGYRAESTHQSNRIKSIWCQIHRLFPYDYGRMIIMTYLDRTDGGDRCRMAYRWQITTTCQVFDKITTQDVCTCYVFALLLLRYSSGGNPRMQAKHQRQLGQFHTATATYRREKSENK